MLLFNVFIGFLCLCKINCGNINFTQIYLNRHLLILPTFDGIGGLSGGGATSKLLVSYPAAAKSQIYDYLFKPNFAASIQMLKVEIGGDSQSTEGTEASHSHFEGDLNCFRGYEWEIMIEAKKRNPNITLYALPWTFPGWVGEYSGDTYKNVTKLAGYIIDWFKCARDKHKLNVDYVGIWNEKAYNVVYIKTLRQTLDKMGFSKVKIIGTDNKWEIAPLLMKDKVLSNAVYAIGAHYPGTVADADAHKTGKPLWSSEDYSTSNVGEGPGCWARILNQNFVNGNMTSTISWNLLAAYYDNLPYPRCGLMTAIEPWSGKYLIPDTIWVTAHTTQFTELGWNYLPINNGSAHLPSGGSYVTLVKDDNWSEFTIIFETMSHKMSVCIRPNLPPYKITDQNMTIIVPMVPKVIKEYYLWQTNLSSTIDTEKFKFVGKIKPNAAGQIFVNLPINHVVTLTTVSTGHKGLYKQSALSKPFPMNYTDTFETYPINAEPNLLTPQVGSFEVVLSSDKKSKVLVQTVLYQPLQWCYPAPINTQPIAVLGNFNRSDYYITVRVMVPINQSANSVFLAARVNSGGCFITVAGGVFYWLNFTSNEMLLSSKYNLSGVYVHVPVVLKRETWYEMTMIIKGNTGWFYLNGQQIHKSDDLFSYSPPHGFVAIGTGNFGYAYYDNLVLNEI